MPKSAVCLTKTNYLEGLECPKLLWYRYHRKYEIPPPSAEEREIIKQGQIVGALARQLFPSGIKIDWEYDPVRMDEKSFARLNQRLPLFEAGLVYKKTYAQGDILLPAENAAWDIIEVKSTVQLKEENYYDAAFQKYVYEGRGLSIRHCYLMHINNQYVRKGKLEIDKLLIKDDITAGVDQLLPEIDERVAAMLEMIAGPEPDTRVGKQCKDCPLHDFCWQFLPEEHVFILRGKNDVAFDLMERGILKMNDIPDDYELTEKHSIQVKSHKANSAFIDHDSLKIFLDKVEYPLYFLDFETIAPAVPVYDLTHPYQDIPFQFSLHRVEKEGAKPVHYAYLAPGDVDPRREVLTRLVKLLGDSGSILAYFAQYEKSVIKSLVALFPEFTDWFENTVNRFIDLYIPFQKLFYYHPGQHGSASMKMVLPALTGITYDGMEIGNGGMARFEYMRVTFENGVPAEERSRVRAALEKYCELDTRGMIEILQALRDAV